jgi:hypothetical protein
MPTTDTGKYVMCGRCRGTGEARYNHLNGDTHCYLCGGVGMRYQASAAEKAREAQEQAWRQATYNALHVGHGYLQQLRRPVREACQQVPWPAEGRRAPQAELDAYEADVDPTRARAAQLTRALTYWVQGDDYAAAVDAAPAAREEALLRTTLAARRTAQMAA